MKKNSQEVDLWWAVLLTLQIKWISLSRFILVNFSLGTKQWETIRQRFERAGVHIFGDEKALIFHLSRHPPLLAIAITPDQKRQQQLWEHGRSRFQYNDEIWIKDDVPSLTAEERANLRNIRNTLGAGDSIFCLPVERLSVKQFVFRRLTLEDNKKRPLETQQPSLAEIPQVMRNNQAGTDIKPTALQLSSQPTSGFRPSFVPELTPRSLSFIEYNPQEKTFNTPIRANRGKRKRDQTSTKDPPSNAKKRKIKLEVHGENTPPNEYHTPGTETRVARPLRHPAKPLKLLDKSRIKAELQRPIEQKAKHDITLLNSEGPTTTKAPIEASLDEVPIPPPALMKGPLKQASTSTVSEEAPIPGPSKSASSHVSSDRPPISGSPPKSAADQMEIDLDVAKTNQIQEALDLALQKHFAPEDPKRPTSSCSLIWTSCSLPTLSDFDSEWAPTNTFNEPTRPVIRKLSRSPRIVYTPRTYLHQGLGFAEFSKPANTNTYINDREVATTPIMDKFAEDQHETGPQNDDNTITTANGAAMVTKNATREFTYFVPDRPNMSPSSSSAPPSPTAFYISGYAACHRIVRDGIDATMDLAMETENTQAVLQQLFPEVLEQLGEEDLTRRTPTLDVQDDERLPT